MKKVLAKTVGKKHVKALFTPKEGSHKYQNGLVLIIAGGKEYHGSAVLAAKAASKLVDLVFFSSTTENNELIKKMRLGLAEVIVLEKKKINEQAKKCDAILVGPGMGRDAGVKNLVNGLLKKFAKAKKIVLDADALYLLDKKLLTKNCLVTPHAREFEALFGKKATEKEVLAQAKKFGCTILLKTPKADIISNGKTTLKNFTGNAGMTKGGTGDVLAGVCVALASKNDLLLSACAAAYLNGLAGDLCKKENGFVFNATDVIEKLGAAYKKSLLA